MFFIAARKDTKVELEKGGRNLDFTNSAIRAAFRSSLCTNYGITDANLSFLYVDEANAAAPRIMNGDNYSIVWDSDEIVGLDFSNEDSLNILRFNVKDENDVVNDTVTANDVDYLTIYAYVFKSDLSEIENTFNDTLLIPIINPYGNQCFIKTTFENGVATKIFKTKEYGIWKIPNGYKFPNHSIKISKEIVYDINATLDL
jgi:hypothetical protein